MCIKIVQPLRITTFAKMFSRILTCLEKQYYYVHNIIICMFSFLQLCKALPYAPFLSRVRPGPAAPRPARMCTGAWPIFTWTYGYIRKSFLFLCIRPQAICNFHSWTVKHIWHFSRIRLTHKYSQQKNVNYYEKANACIFYSLPCKTVGSLEIRKTQNTQKNYKVRNPQIISIVFEEKVQGSRSWLPCNF
jgi:hypothetical protein